MKETKQLLGIPHDYGKPQMVGALRPGREEAPNKSYLNHAEVGNLFNGWIYYLKQPS